MDAPRHPDNYAWDKFHVLDITAVLQLLQVRSMDQAIFRIQINSFTIVLIITWMKTMVKQGHKDKAKKKTTQKLMQKSK